MKKKVFVFVEENVALNYGIGTYLHNLVAAFKEEFSIYVIKLFTRGEYIFKETKDDVIYVKFPYAFKTNQYEERYLKRICFYIRQQTLENESVCFHFNNQQNSLFHILKEQFKNAKFIYTMHYLDWRVFPDLQTIGYSDLCKKNITDSKRIEKITSVGSYIKLFDSIITLSLSTFDIVTKYYLIDKKKVFYIPNCIQDIFSPNLIYEKENIKNEFGLDKDEKICLFVGRIVRNKGVIELMRAFKKVLLQEKKCRLMIVGDGCYDLCLSEISPFYSKISFTGFIDKKTIIKLYHISDIGILPSYFEECNYTVLEMMSSMLPVIITSVPGLIDFVDNNSYLTVPSYDVDQLADKILQLLTYESMRHECSINTRAIYEKRYKLEIFQKRMLKIYQ